MSWDLVVFEFDNPLSDVESEKAIFPDGWEPPNIGSVKSVRTRITEALSDVDWSDPTLGSLSGQGFSLEFNIGKEEVVSHFMIHARGDATQAVVTLMLSTGWCILDTSTGKWMHKTSNLDEGREKFQSYLSKVLDTRSSAK